MINADDLELYAKIGAFLGAVLFAVYKGRSYIKRTTSSDDLAVSADTARVDITKLWADEAERQRIRADKAFEERNAAVQELGSLRAQVASLEQHRTDCERRLAVLEDQLNQLRGIVDRRLNPRV